MKFLYTLLLTIISSNGIAQISLGGKAGINISNLAVKDLPAEFEDGTNSSIGFHFGLFGEFKLSEQLSASTELLYTKRGTKSDDDVRINLNYIEVPILLVYYPLDRVGIELGPNFGYLLSANAVSNDSKGDLNDVYDTNFDFGISAGFKIEAYQNVLFFARYYYGLTKVVEVFFTQDEIASEYNRSVQLGLGYRFK